MSENGEIYTAGKKFYTPAGTDGMDKFYLWVKKWMTIMKMIKEKLYLVCFFGSFDPQGTCKAEHW